MTSDTEEINTIFNLCHKGENIDEKDSNQLKPQNISINLARTDVFSILSLHIQEHLLSCVKVFGSSCIVLQFSSEESCTQCLSVFLGLL